MICRHCGSPVQLVMMDLGTSPPSNAYLRPEQLQAGEMWLPLRVRVCETCWLAQTEDMAGAEAYFTPDYAYFSAFSAGWLKHSEAYVAAMTDRLNLGSQSFVVEVASNDGYLLQYFVERGIPCLGVEPTANTAAAARARGVETVEHFFGAGVAAELVGERGRADLMLGNNVLAHVPDINDFLAGFATMLAEDGVVTFEFPSLERLLDQLQFDTIYHEHFSYLSLTALDTIFPANGLTIFDVESLPTHGGSLRVYGQRADTGRRDRTAAVNAQLERERAAGLAGREIYAAFQARAEAVKDALVAFLITAKREGKKVAAYGAAAKGNTFLNFAGVRGDLIDFVVDKNPAKQGHFMPGSRIPIVTEDRLRADRPDYVLLLPWNLRDELGVQLAYVREWDGRIVTAVPELRID